MKKLAILFLLCGVMPAQTVTEVPQMSVSSLPTSPPLNTVVKVLDPNSSSDCSAGGGNGQTFTPHDCQWNGTSWVLLSGGNVTASTGAAVPVYTGAGTILTPDSFIGDSS